MKCPQPTGDIRGPRITDQPGLLYTGRLRARFNPCEPALILLLEENCSQHPGFYSSAQLQAGVILKWTETGDSAIYRVTRMLCSTYVVRRATLLLSSNLS
jgi:hypothetical protein